MHFSLLSFIEGPERSTKAIFRLQVQKNKYRIDIVVAKSVTSQMELLKAEKYSNLKQKETGYWGFFWWAMTIRRKRIVSDFTAWVEDTEEAGRQMLNVFSGIIFWQQQYWLCLFLEAYNITCCSTGMITWNAFQSKAKMYSLKVLWYITVASSLCPTYSRSYWVFFLFKNFDVVSCSCLLILIFMQLETW